MHSSLFTDGGLTDPPGASGFGRRFARAGGGTIVVWTGLINDVQNGGGLSCCNDLTGSGFLCQGFSYFQYPIITADLGQFRMRQMAPWIFPDGGPGTPFHTDQDFQVPGQMFGVCANNRVIACDVNAANGDECSAVGGTCDTREMGWRFDARTDSLSDGSPNPARCNSWPLVLRGTPNANCSIPAQYGQLGDPGPACAVLNYGTHIRPDVDCDGNPDVAQDLCPHYSEVDPFANGNGDNRGNECQCGDANRSGSVTVADIVQVNVQIFNPPASGTPAEGIADLSAPLSDVNDDNTVNVSDIVGVNLEIFSPGNTSRCGRSPIAGQ
jgi:hypothetical protein